MVLVMREIRDDLPFTASDIRDAAPDYLASRFGATNINPHPTAEHLADLNVTLAEMAIVFGAREAARRRVSMSRVQAISAGISTSDFADVLTNSIRRIVETTYDLETDHRRIAAPVEAKNFNEVSFPHFDLDADLPEILENAEFRNRVTVSSHGGESASVLSYGALIGISRKAIINDDVQLIETVFRQLAASAARLEAEKVYSVLEDNPTLADGSALFTGDNLLASAAFSKAKLGEVFAKLRRQTGAAGAITNNRPSYLLVPPEQEVAALSVVAELSNNRPPVAVIASPWVASANWYLMADPQRSPVIGLMRLAGSTRSVHVGRGSAKLGAEIVPIKTAADFGVTALSRIGVVKAQEGS